jgi:hypothetical protein
MDSLIKDLTVKHDMAAVGKLGHLIGENPQLIGGYKSAMEKLKATQPGFYGSVQMQLNQNANFDKRGGGAEALSAVIGSLGAIAGGKIFNKPKGIDLQFKLGADSKAFGNLMNQNTANDRHGYELMLQNNGTGKPGGATTDFSAAQLDRGDWSIRPIFGLMYPAEQEVAQ